DDGADCRSCRFKLIERADLSGILIGNVLHAQLALERCKRSITGAVAKCSTWQCGRDGEHAHNIALPVDGMMPFVGGGDIESTACITQIRANDVAVRTVVAEENPRRWCAAGRIVTAGAIGFAGGDVVADPGAVLPRRVQQIPLEAAYVRRFIPN